MNHSPSPRQAYGNTLKAHNLRDTQPRRAVMTALASLGRAVSATEIQRAVTDAGEKVNTVTVYRILEAFQETGIVHREPETGNFFLCQLPEESGHHIFLHCLTCGKTEERTDHELCDAEDAAAKRAGFTPVSHVTEIRGTCRECAEQ